MIDKDNLTARIEECILSGGNKGSSRLPRKPEIFYCRLMFPARQNLCKYGSEPKVEDISYGDHTKMATVFYCKLKNVIFQEE